MYTDVLSEIINNLKPETLPPEYIIMGRIVDIHGRVSTIRGRKLKSFLADDVARNAVQDARIIIDVRKIKIAFATEVGNFFDELDRLMVEDQD